MKYLLPMLAALCLSIACQAPGALPGPDRAEQETLSPSDLSLEELLDRHLAALGGRENLAAVTSVRKRGVINSPEYRGEPVTVLIRDRERYRMEVDSAMRTVFAFDGETPWEIAVGQGRSEPKAMDLAEVPSFRRDADIGGPLVDPQAKGYQVELLGKSEKGYKLRETFDDGEVLVLYLDPTSFLVTLTVAERGRGTQSREYGQYREVGGVQWPFKYSVTMQPGGYRQTIAWDEIEVNPDLPDGLFAMDSR